MKMPSTYSPKSLITELNSIRLRTWNIPLKTLCCKGTSTSTLCILCSPSATNALNYLSFQSIGLYLVYRTHEIYCHMSWGKSGSLCLPLPAYLRSLSKEKIKMIGLDTSSLNSDFSSFPKIHLSLRDSSRILPLLSGFQRTLDLGSTYFSVALQSGLCQHTEIHWLPSGPLSVLIRIISDSFWADLKK